MTKKISKPQKFSELTIELAKKILKAHLLEQVRIYANEDSDKLCGQLRLRGGMTHFFSRLDGLLASCDKKNLRENFKARLESELRGGSQFEEHLKNLYMANEQKFFDVFSGLAPLPREVQDVLKDSGLEKVRGDIDFTEKDFSDDEFFAEYLTNYFRFLIGEGAGVDGGKFDFEVVERGATGKLNLLITLRGRHIGEKILNVVARLLKKLQDGVQLDKTFLEKLISKTERKSRFVVAESYVASKNFAEITHTRNKIDHFTGGTLQGTLFTTKPVYQKNLGEPTLKIHFEIRDAKDFEAGACAFPAQGFMAGARCN